MKKQRMSNIVTNLFVPVILVGLTGCANYGAQPNVPAQPNQAQIQSAQVKNAPITRNNMNPGAPSVDQPYVHNYDGTYNGTRPNTYTEQDVRSAELLSRRVTQIAKSVSGVNSAQAVAQGIDVVIGVDAGGHNPSIERQVHHKVKAAEPGYNIYVTTDPDLQNRVRTLFTAMTNVRHGQITHGISGIIYEMGRKSR
ncbi:YhcN/YlaJ family sporulation lipoprotein [Brevibacillus sp. SYSU BS000544]|uniref:YhcN/YlaJ family sporulation lipoprotein n=1 Tax=Brevibacillus sp. SYSU BS000544 TaxID=3416443 RepID=UPI003CE46899